MKTFNPSNKLELSLETLNVFFDMDSMRAIKFLSSPRNMQDIYMKFRCEGTGSRRKWARLIDDLESIGVVRKVSINERRGEANWRERKPKYAYVTDIFCYTMCFDGSKLNLLINNEVKIVHEVD